MKSYPNYFKIIKLIFSGRLNTQLVTKQMTSNNHETYYKTVICDYMMTSHLTEIISILLSGAFFFISYNVVMSFKGNNALKVQG